MKNISNQNKAQFLLSVGMPLITSAAFTKIPADWAFWCYFILGLIIVGFSYYYYSMKDKKE